MATPSLLDRLAVLEDRYREVSTLISDPAVIADQERYVRLTREYHDLGLLSETAARYRAMLAAVDEAKASLASEQDEELRDMARQEADEAAKQIPQVEEQIKVMLIPPDPDDAKNCIVELRSGTGGDEAALFAGDLFRMYQKFAERKGWQLAVSSVSEGAAGGFKEIVFTLNGDAPYGVMKYESGVHRVQRVPKTESQGRIHTSTATVAVLPEADEIDVEINENDLRIDVYRAGGPGGQCVNTTDSAVRITHLPTGLGVQSQDQKSQLQNKIAATAVLRARLYEKMLAEQQAAVGAERLAQLANHVGARLIHLSTDMVFDGSDAPYKNTDIPKPCTL